MSETHSEAPACPRWLHVVAVLTVCAALPLLLLGAEVTTKKVGMVDEQGFRTPWHLFSVPAWEKGVGFVIEHSHRLFGFLVGFCVIVLAIGLWRWDRRRWVGWLGLAALAGVSIQGLLGGYRVQLNALLGPELALIHGCFAQVVFALFVSLAVVTSRRWAEAEPTPAPAATLALRRWALLAVGLLYLQIVLGAFVRRSETRWAPRLHLLIAFAAVAVLVLVVRAALAHGGGRRLLRTAAVVLLVLLGTQLFLGMESWLTRFRTMSDNWMDLKPLLAGEPRPTAPPGGRWAALYSAVVNDPGFVRSLHFLTGALLFALTASLTLYAYRGLRLAAGREPAPKLPLEEAA